MATDEEISERHAEAQLLLLDSICKSVERGAPSNALRFAEAYAWLNRPDQSHGGGSDSGKG